MLNWYDVYRLKQLAPQGFLDRRNNSNNNSRAPSTIAPTAAPQDPLPVEVEEGVAKIEEVFLLFLAVWFHCSMVVNAEIEKELQHSHNSDTGDRK